MLLDERSPLLPSLLDFGISPGKPASAPDLGLARFDMGVRFLRLMMRGACHSTLTTKTDTPRGGGTQCRGGKNEGLAGLRYPFLDFGAGAVVVAGNDVVFQGVVLLVLKAQRLAFIV